MAPSIFNIKAQGLAQCILWSKLSQDEVYAVCFEALMALSDGRACKKYFCANSDKISGASNMNKIMAKN